MICFLPPVSEGWGGTVFTGVFLSTRGGGYPSPRFFPRSRVPGPFPWDHPSLAQGYPSSSCGYPSLNWGSTPGLGVSSPSQGYPRTGVLPSQDRTGVSPSQDWGNCWPGLGYPLTGTGLPPGQDMGTPQLGLGYLPCEIEQQSEYLQRGGRYASCGHAEEFSCLLICS